ncbi:hypothetical protein GOP47_0007759 [Adiantum capillus-veneris]|uniref:non-specific serine/threonine protein kinase n=1 Tax=Adiantum capillus-veneris TaxID=13818 RepID=A0A9D4ZM99_ADICA|nr:hypothetical protein GOP47_0007759 [Adiantum capillus-veneris]
MASLQATATNARPTVPLPGAPVDRFLGWALPFLSNANTNGDTAEVALLSLNEFLVTAELSSTERYIPSVLRSCQALLEDEGTPSKLLRPLVGILTVLASRFYHIFQPHFADLVDLLLGWALMPDLLENDRCLIIDTFLQFQSFWASNLPFSSNLLFKFLADMEVLAHDAIPGTLNEPRRLWALVSCFVAVLQATTTGILEIGFAADAADCFQMLLPRLLACLGMVGQKFRSFKWLKEAAVCLALFANLFREKFSKFSCLATDFILSSINFGSLLDVTQSASILSAPGQCRFPIVTASQMQEILKVNLELISLQGCTLTPSVVSKLLQAGSPLSFLRLHPSPLVTGVVSETYLLLLRHDADQVVHIAINCLFDELTTLRNHIFEVWKEDQALRREQVEETDEPLQSSLSDAETRELIKYDLLLLTSAAFLLRGPDGAKEEKRTIRLRANDIKKFLLEQMNPFKDPLQYCADVQFTIVQSLHRICCLNCNQGPLTIEDHAHQEDRVESAGHLCIGDSVTVCGEMIARALHSSASLPVKLEALDWLVGISSQVLAAHSDSSSCQLYTTRYTEMAAIRSSFMSKSVMFALLTAASDREHKVREKVAVTMEMLLQAKLIASCYLQDGVEIAIERLGDSEPATQKAFLQFLALCAPASLWTKGVTAGEFNDDRFLLGSTPKQWKKVFTLRRFSKYLRPQQVVSILTFIAQQWQVLPSFWLQRLIQNFPKDTHGIFETDGKGLFSVQDMEPAKSGQLDIENVSLTVDLDFLERTCASNNLACAWWAVQEAAWHCVVVRLRTHLGGPTQTFGVLERMLLDVVQSLQADNVQREGGNGIPAVNVQLLPMRLLLEFVDSLKKNIHNASEGSIILPAASPASAHFFRANRKVCEEWFARICEALMNASLVLQCHAATYHHAVLKLSDLRSAATSVIREFQRPQTVDGTSNKKLKVKQDVLRTLRVTSLALCRAREPSMISGLQVWASSVFGSLLLDDALPMQSAFESLGWMTGMTLQAQGQYESAAIAFSRMLQSDDALSSLGADGVQFLIARIIESYVALADWEALELWLQELQILRAQHAGKAYAGALTTAGHDMNSIHALACFDTGDVQGAWGHLDLTPQTSGDLTPDPYQALQRSEQMLLQAMLRSEGGMANDVCLKEAERAKVMLEEALLVSGFDCLKQAGPLLMQLHCINAFEVKCNSSNISKNETTSSLHFSNALGQVSLFPMDANYQDCLLWVKLLRVYRAVIPHHKVTTQLHWQVLKLARKQHNLKLCHRLLKQLSLQCEADIDLFLFDYERILLQFTEESLEDAISALWGKVQTVIVNSQALSACKKSIRAKACLKFASWIKQKPNLFTGLQVWEKVDSIEADARLGSSVIADDSFLGVAGSAHNHEEVIGAAIKSAALMCPNMGKAWFAYGNWCLSLAKSNLSKSTVPTKSCMFPQILNSEFSANRSNFTEQEVKDISTIVMHAVQEMDEASLTSIPADIWASSKSQAEGGSLEAFVQHLMCSMQMATGAMETGGESPAGVLSFQLKQEILGFFPGMNSSQVALCVNKLMELWWALRKRQVERSKGAKKLRQDDSLTSSLHVLHLLLNYGVELKDALVKGISSVSLRPWQEITDQLFARLTNHPEAQVRKQLENLLMSLARSSPWAVVYSVLMKLNTADGEPAAELQRLLGCLLKVHPKLVKDVQLFISELGRVTVLWEERWLSTLQDLHADVARHISSLKEAAVRLAQDSALSASDKLNITSSNYFSVMSPVIQTLERTMAITSRAPGTLHEVKFQEQYNSQLRAAFSAVKALPLSLSTISDVWHPFDAIVTSLASHVKKSVIPIAEIAPKLSMLSSSSVPMPGLERQVGADDEGEDYPNFEIVSVTAFDEQVQILPTKTKPKKLTLIGSDGETYTYLLKGHEDLRLDARIMQLLHAVNGMLFHYKSTRGKNLAARYYSVTPISGQAGLIQWVDNLVSMYTVFKAWQQRNHSLQYASSSNANPPVAPAVPRPSDMFYGKLLPALKERGVRKVSSRRDWPQEVKRKVLVELMKETPRHLLYKELWCASDCFTSFNRKLQRFSGSVAVMSMVGYILGLGDRHLDNIMMDFCTGDIMHIDYNVCFEKGLRLKIPEIVPFRLTQTVQAALGLTGVEGMFRQTCETVLDTLQQNKDVILMLLDVFVWDPLTEWTKNDSGQEDIQIWKEDKKGKEVLFDSSLPESHLQEGGPTLMQEAASQEAKSQEDSVSFRAVELSLTRDDVENLADVCDNLGEFIDEHILSQAEKDCWISPPSSDFGCSSDKEAENPTDFYWLQSADSLSGSRNWQRNCRSDLPQQKDGEEGMPELSALDIQEEKAEALDLLSQGSARILEAINTNLDETKVRLNSSRRQQDLQTPMSLLTGAPFHSPSDPFIGASTDFSNGLETGQTSRDVRQMQPSDGDTQTTSIPEASMRISPQKNPYAVSVLERIQWKLNGLDYESRRHSTVSEQVDHLLRQAMSIDNLCNMYEGWTPWI